MKQNLVIILLLMASFSVKAQYYFSGHVDNKAWHDNVYLSLIEDYRKMSGVYTDQIIAKVKTDSLGFFKFTGDGLENQNRIYRIHVDNCFDDEINRNHFDGHCTESKEIIFIAKNKDTIVFPFSFENQMFCDITSNNIKSNVFVKIDSLREHMKFSFSEYRSEANRKLNTKKWFKTLQDFGEKMDEPLAELYIYSSLSERSNDLHEHYLEDLKSNNYYDELLEQLTNKYPNSPYTNQYRKELLSDKFILNNDDLKSESYWHYLLYLLLGLSLIFNIWLVYKLNGERSKSLDRAKEELTTQEQNILKLLLEEKSNKEIADTLFVSLSTVKTHVNNIYKKLKVQSRSEIKSLFNN